MASNKNNKNVPAKVIKAKFISLMSKYEIEWDITDKINDNDVLIVPNNISDETERVEAMNKIFSYLFSNNLCAVYKGNIMLCNLMSNYFKNKLDLNMFREDLRKSRGSTNFKDRTIIKKATRIMSFYMHDKVPTKFWAKDVFDFSHGYFSRILDNDWDELKQKYNLVDFVEEIPRQPRRKFGVVDDGDNDDDAFSKCLVL